MNWRKEERRGGKRERTIRDNRLTLSDLALLLQRLSQLATAPLLAALVLSAIVISLIRNWRLALPVMIGQYVVVGIMLARVTQPGVALIKLLAGILVCLSLSIAAQRADELRASRGESVAAERIRHPSWRSVPAQVLLRAVATALVLTAAFGAATRFPLPKMTADLALAAYALIGTALLLAATAHEALNTGIGLLMFISGVELAYAPLEPSVSVAVLLGLVTVGLGVALSYLTLADVGDPIRAQT